MIKRKWKDCDESTVSKKGEARAMQSLTQASEAFPNVCKLGGSNVGGFVATVTY